MSNIKTQKTTIADIAEMTGISPATISRVLNQKGNVSPQTEAIVMAAVDKLDYHYTREPARPKPPADIPKSLLLIVSSPKDPIFNYVLDGATHMASNLGYHIFTITYKESMASAQEILAFAAGCHACGLLLYCDLADEILAQVQEQIPTVLLMAHTPLEGVSYFTSDFYADTVHALEHFIAQGRKKIALINAVSVSSKARLCHQAYLDTLGKHGLEADPARIASVSPDFRADTAMSAAQYLLAAGCQPDAVFCTSDIYSSSMLNTCLAWQIRVPDELSIISYGNTTFCHLTMQALSALEQPAYYIGFMACEHLIHRTLDPQLPVKQIKLSSNLVLSGS